MTGLPQTRSEQLREQASTRVGMEMPGGWLLGKMIGFGGAAAVYEARRDDERVAIKVMHQQLSTSTILQERFLREAQIGMDLVHPNLMSIYSSGTLSTGESFMVMELLEGINVRMYLKNRGGTLPVDEALKITQQVLAALKMCHEEGVFHRDLKPSNLFINRAMQVRVLDFGVAHLEQNDQQLTREGTALGTPAFMPPEQARGRTDLLDARSDLFSVGATLYTMLTGRLLHKANTSEESLILAATKPAESIARINATLPTPVVHMVDKALTWNPKKRFQSAQEMRQMIDDYLGADAPPTIAVAQMAKGAALSQTTDEDLSFSDESKQPESSLDDRSMGKAIGHMFSLAERYMSSSIQYGEAHRETQRSLEGAYEGLVELLSQIPQGHLTLKIAPHSLSYKKEVVYEPSTQPFDQIPYNLFSSGLRQIVLGVGVGQDEFQGFLNIIKMDPRRDMAPEDDLSTMLWQENMEHIKLQLVSSFQLDDSEEQTLFIKQCKKAQSSVERAHAETMKFQLERTRMLLSLDQEALAQAQGNQARMELSLTDASPTHAGALRLEELQSLRKALNTPKVNLEQRLPFVLTEAYEESLRGGDLEIMVNALRDLMQRYIMGHRVLAALTLYGRLVACISDRNKTQDLTQNLFNAALIKRIIQTYVDWLGDERSEETATDERNLKHLKELLSHMNGSHGELIAESYLKSSRARGLVVLFYAYFKRYTKGNEEHIGKMLPHLSLGHCKKLIELLVHEGTDEALDALRHVDRHEDTTLKLSILEMRAQKQPERVVQQLESMINDKDTSLRIRALQVAQKYAIEGMSAALEQRIEQDKFFDLPYSERRLLLNCLIRQNQRAAYRIALNILKSHGLVANDTRNTTRVLAVEILGNLPITPEVKEALQAATKRRWWNSKEVQGAAQALLDRP